MKIEDNKYRTLYSKLRTKRDQIGLEYGEKLWYELNFGEVGHIAPASIFNINSGISTMYQKAGEISISVIGRLTNYLNRHGINQENLTDIDRTNSAQWHQRMKIHPLYKTN